MHWGPRNLKEQSLHLDASQSLHFSWQNLFGRHGLCCGSKGRTKNEWGMCRDWGHCFGEYKSCTSTPWSNMCQSFEVDYGLDQLVINNPHVGNCIGDNVRSPIPWATWNLMICINDIFETLICSSGEETKFECDDKEMTEPLNLGAKMPLDGIMNMGSWRNPMHIPILLDHNDIIEYVTLMIS